MIEMDLNHCQIVGMSLAGERAVDEQTFASLAVLGERLERLKSLDNAFEGVAFSPNVSELEAAKDVVLT
jgi:hypothetical protein